MSDDKLIERITTALDTSVEHLDGATRSRLNQARHRALTTRHRPRWTWTALGGALAASLVAVMVWHWHPVTPEQESLAALDFELLSEGDNVELYQEMEFLQWLEETEQNDVV